MTRLDTQKTVDFSKSFWDAEIVPTLSKYIEIPNQSPLYDPEWATNGLAEKAMDLIYQWVQKQSVQGMTCEIKKIEGKSPILLIVVNGNKNTTEEKTVLLYGHMDKQPPLTDQWDADLHPYKPVIKNGRLYGRGGADDGYSTFASIAAVLALQKQNIPHDRYVIIIEGSEESGSIHLTDYIIQYADIIKTPSLVICLDSGCGNYDQLWMTSSLRGVLTGDLTVKVLKNATHSGSASGIVPDSFRALRIALTRLEDVHTGELVKGLQVEIPPYRIEQVKKCAEILGETVFTEFEWVDQNNPTPITKDPVQLLLNKTWKPTLTVTGADNLPPLTNAGNVLRTHTSVKISVRLPPSLKTEVASKVIKETLEKDPPYGTVVTFKQDKGATGWDSPKVEDWLEKAMEESSNLFFNKPHVYFGEGGTIPFMGMLGERFPKAQFVITGLLGPASNAHGPNEFLDIEYGKKLLCCVAYMLDAHAAQN
eukprot:gene2083-2570_t